MSHWYRNIVNLLEAAENISSNELENMFAGIGTDLAHLSEWLDAEPTFKFKVESIAIFEDMIEKLMIRYNHSSEDENRVNKIVHELKNGAKQWPVFSDANAYSDEDAFVMEGRHRLIAFHILKYETVPVVYVSTDQ